MTLQAVLREELYGWPAGDHGLPAARSSSYSSGSRPLLRQSQRVKVIARVRP